MIGEFDPSSNSFVHAYIWGANGLNTRISDPVGLSTTVLGYSFDPSGNVVGRHPFGDSQQPVQSAQLFDAYGERIYDEETTALSDPIGYKGQWGCYTDPELPLQYQLVYCHNRYYSPYLGRWISRDPAGADGGLNAYEFCGNNPIMNSDPSGLFFTTTGAENAPRGEAPGITEWGDGPAGLWDWAQDSGGVLEGYGEDLWGLVKSIANNSSPAIVWRACHGDFPSLPSWDGSNMGLPNGGPDSAAIEERRDLATRSETD